MGVFGSQDTSSQTGGDSEQDHQEAMVEIIDSFDERDIAALAAVTPAARAEQLAARRALYDHVDRMWDGAKAADPHAGSKPEYGGVAAMRDLATALVSHVEQAQHAAGDDTD